MTALGALVFTLAASVSTFQGRALQPETYTSPSGEWRLRVEPSELFEPKQAGYTMTRGDQEVWRVRHPFGSGRPR